MSIRSKTLRLIILISTVLVTIIITMQLYWLQKVYTLEQKQFNINVSKSIRALYDDMELVNDVSDNTQKIIENPQPDLYLLSIDCSPNLDSLWLNLKAEFIDFDVYTDCEAAVYSHETNAYYNQQYIDLPDAYHAPKGEMIIPLLKKDYAYVALYFPHRSEYILQQMYFWIASGALLLLTLIAFGASIFYLYRQKFLNETQKDFVNNFTHEFKTPLAVIKIASEVLQQPNIIEKPDKLKQYAAIIDDQTAHLQVQTQRLLEIAYTDSNNLPIEKQPCNINNLVQQAINDILPLIEQKNATVQTSFSTSIDLIAVDKYYLLLAIINLIENAVKYANNPKINIATCTQGNYCCIAINDNGIGISKENQKKIFNRFFRVTTGDLHNVKGFGLGLNFVKKVVDAHRGKVTVTSKPENGSTFIIKIPRQ